MTKKKKVIIAISVIMAVAIVAVCVIVPTMYMHGRLGDIHKLNMPKDGQIRVACVGDSLTYGHSVPNWPENNYPTVLGKLLGDKYCVNNYGYSGRTASKTSNMPYTNEKLYRQSIDFAPNIVIIMLGSNDTKSANWKGKEQFVKDYTEIIQSYLALESVKAVYIMSPTPVFMKNGRAPYGINIELVATDVHDAAKEIAESIDGNGKAIHYLDLYPVFEYKQELFVDGAHPNKAGARLLAVTVYDNLNYWRNLEVFNEDGTIHRPFM